MTQATVNGGFPMPAPGGRQRHVETTHAACSGRTRVSLPEALPTRVVRRVVCEHCEELFEAAEVREVRKKRALPRLSAPALPALGMPSRPTLKMPTRESLSMPSRFDPRWLTLPVAALAVFAVLSLVSGGEDSAPSSAEPAASTAAESESAKPGAEPRGAKAGGKAGGSKPAPVPTDAQLVSESTFSLALPAGWDRVNPAAGATFAAVSEDGTADATLWIQSDPKLDLATFEANSLKQLETLAGSAQVVERKVGPSVESSSIVLAPKGVPEGSPTYEVVLRGAGDNWYYLATTYQASAPAEAVGGVDLIQGSFIPRGDKG